MLLVVAIFIFCAAIFFKITDIVVEGNNLYTDEEVVKASGLALGDNLLAVSRGTVAGRIQASLPYVEDVQVGRALPGTVTVTVRESDAVYAVYAANGTVWLMNSSGKLLEQASPGASSYPWLVGVTVQTPQAGDQAVCAETEALDAALTVIQLLEATDYLPKIVEIDDSGRQPDCRGRYHRSDVGKGERCRVQTVEFHRVGAGNAGGVHWGNHGGIRRPDTGRVHRRHGGTVVFEDPGIDGNGRRNGHGR